MAIETVDLTIRSISPLTETGRALIDASQKALEEVFTADEIFTLDASELAAPNAQFFVAELGGAPVGCIALVDMFDYGEIKRLYVAPEARGHGIGRRLVAAVEDAARDIGLKIVRLETGPELAAALRIYEAMGYTRRDRFGDYEQVACSLFMEKALLSSGGIDRVVS